MAEILGLIASVIAVIQLTKAVEKKASRYLHTVKGAQSALVPLLGKTRNLSSILSTLQTQLQQTHRSHTLQHLVEPLKLCEALLEKLKTRLENLRIVAGCIVAGCVVGPVLDKDCSNQLRRLDDLIPILQLALDADSLASTQAIEEYIQVLRLENAEQTQILHGEIQAHRADARQWKKDEDRQREITAESELRSKVIRWLTVVDPEANYLAACQRHQPGTGTWLLESTEFVDLESGRDPCLWLNAMAGAGKTILSSTVIRHLRAKYGDACVVYYFFDFKDPAKQDVESLLKSLLIQSVGSMKLIPKPVLDIYQRHCLGNPEQPTAPTINELVETLIYVLAQLPTVFIVVDALDECKQITVLLKTLCGIVQQSEPNCRILLTSRAETAIQRGLEEQSIKGLEIQNATVDRDVALYVRAVLETDERLRSYRQTVKDLIVETLTNGAKGMFRWVQCQIDHLKTLRTAKVVKFALGNLPPDLDQTYDRILLSIDPADLDLLRKALQLIVFSARPLLIQEVAEAVIIEPGASQIDEDDRLQRPTDLLDIGKSLFVQSKARPSLPFLELSDYSVKEYLLSERIKTGQAAAFSLNETSAETENAVRMLTYLGLDVFENDWQIFDARIWESPHQSIHSPPEEFFSLGHEQHLTDYPLLDYAAKNCFSHHCKLEPVQIAVSPLVRKLFLEPRNGRFRNMTYTCVYSSKDPEASFVRAFRYTLLSITARYGLSIVVQYLLANGIPADILPARPDWIDQYPEGQTALDRAAEFGHEALCNILIKAGASVHGLSPDDCPLATAAQSGEPSIVRMMTAAGADVHRDAGPLSKSILRVWRRCLQDKVNSKWREILELLRDAGAKWSTVSLLAAFSEATTPLLQSAVSILPDTSFAKTRTEDIKFEYVIDCMDSNILDALQLLVRDDAGVKGIKASLETILRAIYESQPHLLTLDAYLIAFYPSKFSAEEVFAENLIHIYFRPLCQTNSQYTPPNAIENPSRSLLTALWDNTSAASPAVSPNKRLFRAAQNERKLDADGLIVCGEILRAWIQARWEDDYVHYYD